MLMTLPTSIFFSVPNVISTELAIRCGREIVPETPQALNARVEALKQLRMVSIQAEQAAQGSRMWDRQRIENLYEEVKHHDPTQWSTVTLEHATALLYTRPGYINYYATHKYLMERPLRYIADTGYIRTQEFRVRPERDIKEIQTVEQWITEYRFNMLTNSPYKLFIGKAKRALADYEKTRTRKTGPMTQKNASFFWTKSDQVLLSFLLRSLQQHTTTQLDPYRIGRNAIIKDIMELAEVTDDTIHDFLIRLGVIAPWQDLHALSPQLNPSTDFSTKFPLEKEAEAILRSSSIPAGTNTLLGPLDFRPHDPLDSVRHDFGDMKVFVIDDPTAKELDDGISVERIPTEPENHWVHIHIADPARILHPGHALAHKARKQFSAIYLGTANYPMLPRTLMHDPKYGLSLTDTSETKVVNRVLTFSAKLDPQGNILDHKLRAGILRNVCKTTYDDVNLALGLQLPARAYPFGGSANFEPGPPLTESDVADLRILKKLADAQVAKRIQFGVVVPERAFAEVAFKTEIPANIQSPSLPGSLYQGFPEMQYSVALSSIDDQGARNLVSEMMKLGCRVASRVALEHNVTVIRRSLQPFVWRSEEDVQKVLELRGSQGYISMQDFVKFDIFATTGYYTQEPDAHYQLALPAGEGYCRATSPLRRYMDLVIHWQLHHILLGPNAPPRPPFSSEDMEKLIIEAGTKDVQIRRLQRANAQFYALMYIKRFAETMGEGARRSQGNPLARMKAWTLRKPVRGNQSSITTPVVLPEIGVDAHCHDLPHHLLDLPPGSDLTVKMRSIELGLRRTKMIVELA
jgi:exoribonuclease-2